MVGIIIAALVIILLFRCLCIVPQAQQYVIEFLGKYEKVSSIVDIRANICCADLYRK